MNASRSDFFPFSMLPPIEKLIRILLLLFPSAAREMISVPAGAGYSLPGKGSPGSPAAEARVISTLRFRCLSDF
jgi:hypothetical protein